MSKDPFDGLILDEEEQEIEKALENGDFVSDPNFKESKKIIEKAATQYIELNKTKPITLRIKQTDLIKIKVKANRNGLPYQTMLSALLHDFAEDKKDLVIK
jgi:predicted DNA binding CopG/RHH family protein